MSKDANQENLGVEGGVESSYVSMIKDANRILDTLSRVWRYCLVALLLSLSIVGFASIGFYLVAPSGREQFFAEGVIFIAIAAWIFARNLLLGPRDRCCTEDIPRWKATLASFVGPDNSLAERDGESIIEDLMKVTLATGDWIRQIKRDVFSVLFWPVVATVLFLLSVFQVNIVEFRIIEVAFIVYLVTLALAVYFGVNSKFQRWQAKVDRFRAFASKAIETL